MEKALETDAMKTQTGGPFKPGSGGKKASAPPGRLNIKIVAAAIGAGIVLALAIAFYFLHLAQPEQAAAPVVEPSKPLISTARAEEIHEFRSNLRSQNRSSHNQNLTREVGEDEMVRMAIQMEFSLLANLFDYYMETNAKFYEFFRIISNQYLEKPGQVVELFDNELVPKFEIAERRRKLLRRRIAHDQSVELFNHLDYIAYYDSIAVASFHKFLVEGKPEDFNYASEQIITAKFMIKDYWDRLSKYLEEYKVDYRPDEGVWRRYYGPWEY